MRKWRVLVVDDVEAFRTDVKRALTALQHPEAENGFEVLEEQDFDAYEKRAHEERFDLIILDIRKDVEPVDETAGAAAHDRVLNNLFVPTILYTAHEDKANTSASAFVGVVNKSEGISALMNAVKAILDSRLLRVRDFLDKQQVALVRDTLPQFSKATGAKALSTDMSARLARPLGRALSGTDLRDLLALSQDMLHPEECYIVPPSMAHPMTGDLYASGDGADIVYCVVLNPSCDLVNTAKRPCRLGHVLVAKCLPAMKHPWIKKVMPALDEARLSKSDAEEADEEAAISKKNQKPDVGKLRQTADEKRRKAKEMQRKAETLRTQANNLLRNREPSEHFLHGFGDVPDLIVDYRELSLIPLQELNGAPWRRLASLDSPFAESVNSRFSQFVGRVGTPDVDMSVATARFGWDNLA